MKKLNYLVVIDMQNDFLTGPLGNDHCRRTIGPVCELIKNQAKKGKKARIFFTQDTHGKDYLKTFEGKRLPIKHCIFDTKGWEIAPEVLKALGKATNFRVGKNGFGSDDLRPLMWEKVKEDIGGPFVKHRLTIDMCGVCTSICVLANAVMLRQYFPDAIIRIHKDACGDVDKVTHEAALKVLQMQQCDIV